MILTPPVNPSYNYPNLEHAVGIWNSVDANRPWQDNGYPTSAAGSRYAVSSRQWDSSSSVMDDDLELSTTSIIDHCMEQLDAVGRALILTGLCGASNRWVKEMDPARANARYWVALLDLAMLARRGGVNV